VVAGCGGIRLQACKVPGTPNAIAFRALVYNNIRHRAE